MIPKIVLNVLLAAACAAGATLVKGANQAVSLRAPALTARLAK